MKRKSVLLVLLVSLVALCAMLSAPCSYAASAYFKAPSTAGSGTAVTFSDGTYAIVDANGRLYADVKQSSYLINQGFAPWFPSRVGTMGGWTAGVAEGSRTITNEASQNLTVQVPSGAIVEAVALRVDTALDPSTNWDASCNTGLTTSIASNQSPSKNTKVYKVFSQAVSMVTTGATDITLYKNGGGPFVAGGKISAAVYYRKLDTLPDAP
jgi:hypothetical protein